MELASWSSSTSRPPRSAWRRREQVLDLVQRLGEKGLAVILISHNMHDIFEVADSITVLRLGQMAAQVDARR